MNGVQTPQEAFYVCAGICRVNPKTNRCAGCGRPWEEPTSPGPEIDSPDREDGEAPDETRVRKS